MVKHLIYAAKAKNERRALRYINYIIVDIFLLNIYIKVMLKKLFKSCALGFAPAIIYGATCFALSVPIHATVGGLICAVILGVANVYGDFQKEASRKKSIGYEVPGSMHVYLSSSEDNISHVMHQTFSDEKHHKRINLAVRCVRR